VAGSQASGLNNCGNRSDAARVFLRSAVAQPQCSPAGGGTEGLKAPY
jgi:hypothetical protein